MKKYLKILVLLITIIILSLTYANLYGRPPVTGTKLGANETQIKKASPSNLVVSTTTSLYDTGLLDIIGEFYLTKFNVRLDFIAAGTGQALEAARRGDADVVLVHAPQIENQFLSEGVVGARKIIAYNFFYIVGPIDDPARIKNTSAAEALNKIAETGSVWVSRGDNSGTNIKEKTLWKKAGIEPSLDPSSYPWYVESGTGMGQTLIITDELEGYTLADAGTYLKFKIDGIIYLEVLIGTDKDLLNTYSAMVVNPNKNANVKFSLAVKFIEWLTSEEGQNIIGEFGKEKYMVPLFYPAVDIIKTNSDPNMANMIRNYAFLQGSECPAEWRLGQEQLYQ
ncbi:MAG: substrate-binding domain-containing protein [Candidatus Hadarchaeaceae archaeon]